MSSHLLVHVLLSSCFYCYTSSRSMLQQGKYDYAPTAEAVPQYLEDYDTGGVWGGKEDNLVLRCGRLMRTQEDILTSTIFSSKEKGGQVLLATTVTSTQATKSSTRSSIGTMVMSTLARSSISTSITMSSPGQRQP